MKKRYAFSPGKGLGESKHIENSIISSSTWTIPKLNEYRILTLVHNLRTMRRGIKSFIYDVTRDQATIIYESSCIIGNCGKNSFPSS